MTTSRIDASAWTQIAGTGVANAPAEPANFSWAVAIVGVGAGLNVGWIGLLTFAVAKLMFL